MQTTLLSENYIMSNMTSRANLKRWECHICQKTTFLNNIRFDKLVKKILDTTEGGSVIIKDDMDLG